MRTAHLVDVPVPQILVGVVEVVSLVPQSRVPRLTNERHAKIPVRQILKQIVEVVTRAPHENVQRQTNERFVTI